MSQYPVSSWTVDQTADCAVVLTGGANRVREGLDLLAQGQIQKLIISGVNPKAKLREIFPQLPFYGSISPEDIILEKQSLTTYGNAQQSLLLVEALNCKDVILITSHLHMYRASRTFKAIFPDEITIYKRGVTTSRYKFTFAERVLEAIKSAFYSLWTY